MRTILIDDEQTVLDALRQKITQLSNIEVLGAFTNPHEGLIEVSKHEPDVLFVDIAIAEVNWIKVAKQLKKAIPKLNIVFLADFDKYALEAFDIQAEDYLLKPVEDGRLAQTISKISKKMELQVEDYQPMIACFQKLHFRYYGGKNDTIVSHWRTSKAREVFAYLVHNRGKLVRKDVIVDLFWSESMVKEAFRQLYSTIYQIRKTLAAIDFNVQIVSLEDNYKVELNNNLIDVDVWEEGMKYMPIIHTDNVEAHKRLIYLYKGAYFEEENYMWSVNERNRLRVKWINHLKRVVSYFISNKSYGEAILLYLSYQKVIPYKQDSYFELMKLYAQYDDRYAVKEQYYLLKEMVREQYWDEPDEEIVSWYENWRN